MPAYVIIPADLEPAKSRRRAVRRARGRGQGTYDDVNRLCAEVADDTAGPSSTSTSGRSTPRAPRRWASRSPSSWAGGCPTSGRPDGLRRDAGKDRQGVQRARRDRAGRRAPVAHVRGAGEGVLADRGRLQGGAGAAAGQAGDDRAVAGDRRPRRRLVRARRRPAHRRRDGRRHRRRARPRDRPAGPHRGHPGRDRRGRHRRDAGQAGCGGSHRPSRPHRGGDLRARPEDAGRGHRRRRPRRLPPAPAGATWTIPPRYAALLDLVGD